MKKILAALFALGVLAVAMQADQKAIKDAAEYNAYIAALNTQDAAQKAAAMEAFVQKYPGSVVFGNALEQAMTAYQQAGNQTKVEEVARRILKLDPDNVRALAIVTFLERTRATHGDRKTLAELGGDAQRGLAALDTWTAPEGMTDADFKKLRNQMIEIFNGAAGLVSLQKKEYAVARDYYLKSTQVDPSNLQDFYQLAIADLQDKPLNPDGFWYAAKAFDLAEAKKDKTAQENILAYGKAKYSRYHGSDAGWDQIAAAAAGQAALPDGFASTIKRAPTPADEAVIAVIENDPASLSFSDYEFILSHRDVSPVNEAAAKKVWNAIQAKQKNGAAKLAFPAKVISASGNIVHAAIADDNRQANQADIEVTLAEPSQTPPAAGAETQIVGLLSDYKTKPFMFLMKDGELRVANPAATTGSSTH